MIKPETAELVTIRDAADNLLLSKHVYSDPHKHLAEMKIIACDLYNLDSTSLVVDIIPEQHRFRPAVNEEIE